MHIKTIAALTGAFMACASMPALAACDGNEPELPFTKILTPHFNKEGTITLTLENGISFESYPGVVVTEETMGTDVTRETMAFAYFRQSECSRAERWRPQILSRVQLWQTLEGHGHDFYSLAELSKAWIAMRKTPCSKAEKFIYDTYDRNNGDKPGSISGLLCRAP